ncbi:MAG: hypothetical protein J7K77_01415 [Dehalococcoidales bacterium]|nr:hypothetical protein [Dehalococcoidales bacterium]
MIPVIVNSPEPMVKARVITLKEHSEQAIRVLQGVGVLHVEQSQQLTAIDRDIIDRRRQEVGELLTMVRSMLGYIAEKQEVSLEKDTEVIYTRPFSEIDKEVRSVCGKFTKLREREVKVNTEIERLKEEQKYLGYLAQDSLKLSDLEFSGGYLFSRLFLLSGEAYENLYAELEGYLFGTIVTPVEDEIILYVVGEVKNQLTVEALVNGAGGRVLPLPSNKLTLREFLSEVGDKLQHLEEKAVEVKNGLQRMAAQEVKNLVLFSQVLSAENQRLRVLSQASEARYIALVEGWLPEKNAESAIFELKNSLDHVFVDTRQPEPAEEPPTELRNPKAMKPFEIVVNLFATPKYREWDPTPIISYSFALFFGLMVGDVVYAVGLILVARFLLGKFLGGSSSPQFKMLQRLIYISGGVALTLGLLTGSYMGNIYTLFGFESPALSVAIQHALQNPIIFVIIALIIGFIHVNIAHIITLVKGIKQRNKGMILNKVGLIVLQLGVPYILHVMLHVSLPMFAPLYAISQYLIVVGIVLLAVGSVKQWGGIGGMMWIFDITGLMGDVMSYCRLAGVGLATFYLGAAFNMLAQLFNGMLSVHGLAGVIGGAILAVIILIIGHLLNLVLSFITGFVHSLRLCFVEFLIKFYEGGGRQYSPFRLVRRTSVVIQAKS